MVRAAFLRCVVSGCVVLFATSFGLAQEFQSDAAAEPAVEDVAEGEASAADEGELDSKADLSEPWQPRLTLILNEPEVGGTLVPASEPVPFTPAKSTPGAVSSFPSSGSIAPPPSLNDGESKKPSPLQERVRQRQRVVYETVIRNGQPVRVPRTIVETYVASSDEALATPPPVVWIECDEAAIEANTSEEGTLQYTFKVIGRARLNVAGRVELSGEDISYSAGKLRFTNARIDVGGTVMQVGPGSLDVDVQRLKVEPWTEPVKTVAPTNDPRPLEPGMIPGPVPDSGTSPFAPAPADDTFRPAGPSKTRPTF